MDLNINTILKNGTEPRPKRLQREKPMCKKKANEERSQITLGKI
jgi:hypothetical protein